jgi:hypothetical protein
LEPISMAANVGIRDEAHSEESNSGSAAKIHD